MPSFEIMMGSMFTGDEARAKALGAMIHYVMMGTVAFGILYALLYGAFDSVEWWVGVAIGIVHGLVVGLVAMPMMPAMHPRMVAGEPIAPQVGEIRLSPSGVMGKNWGAMTPLGVVMGHAVYGLVHALSYGALV